MSALPFPVLLLLLLLLLLLVLDSLNGWRLGCHAGMPWRRPPLSASRPAAPAEKDP